MSLSGAGTDSALTRREEDIMNNHPLLVDAQRVRRVNVQTEGEQPAGSIVATDDPELIRAWAHQHSAEPATGEATESGPATVNVQDGGAGIRFNFPAAASFRPISWDEWSSTSVTFPVRRPTAAIASCRGRSCPIKRARSSCLRC
jgi:hypothetical protein